MRQQAVVGHTGTDDAGAGPAQCFASDVLLQPQLAVVTDDRLAAVAAAHPSAGRDRLVATVVQQHGGLALRGQIETHAHAATVGRCRHLLDRGYVEIGGQAVGVDRDAVAMPATQFRQQQVAAAVGASGDAVFVQDRHVADAVGRDHREGVADTTAGKALAVHQHQAAVALRERAAAIVDAVDAEPQLASTRAPTRGELAVAVVASLPFPAPAAFVRRAATHAGDHIGVEPCQVTLFLE